MHASSIQHFYGLLLRSVSRIFSPDLVDRLNLAQGLPKPISYQEGEIGSSQDKKIGSSPSLLLRSR